MHEWIDALRYEFEAQGMSVADSRVGTATSQAKQRAESVYERAVGRLGSTSEGAQVGEWTRKATSLLADLPVLSLVTEVAAQRNCVDLCASDVRVNPSNPTSLVLLTEALERARRDRLAMRSVRALLDPTAFITYATVHTAASLGASPLPVRLVQRAHRLVSLRPVEQRSYDDLHALARLYLRSDKPGLAIRYAAIAVQAARRQRAALRESPDRRSLGQRFGSAFRKDGWRGLLAESDNFWEATRDKVSAHVLADFAALEPHVQAEKREGAALVTIAWAYRDLQDLDSARAAANRAIDVGFSGGQEVLAATVPPGQTTMTERLAKRYELLNHIDRIDRAYYYGHWRGSMRTAGAVTAGQVGKTVRLVERMVSTDTGKEESSG